VGLYSFPSFPTGVLPLDPIGGLLSILPRPLDPFTHIVNTTLSDTIWSIAGDFQVGVLSLRPLGRGERDKARRAHRCECDRVQGGGLVSSLVRYFGPKSGGQKLYGRSLFTEIWGTPPLCPSPVDVRKPRLQYRNSSAMKNSTHEFTGLALRTGLVAPYGE